MILALLDGRKTQTRRIVKPQPSDWITEWGYTCFTPDESISGRGSHPKHGPSEQFARLKYGMPGDRLWVKETWSVDSSLDGVAPHALDPKVGIQYLADAATRGTRESFERGKTRVSIHMTRWASRITLEITDVRVERLQSISEDNARAEGLKGNLVKYGVPDRDGWPGGCDLGWEWADWNVDPRKAYKRLWNQINGPEGWDANPFVWCLSFRRVTP